MRIAHIVLITVVVVLPCSVWGQKPEEVAIVSTADGTPQAAMFHAPESQDAVPLVVALHTWSGDYRQTAHQAVEQWCVEQGWAYIHPDFRGPNKRPEATGSPLVVQDILDAVAYARQQAHIDSSAIYLVGTSGGGYAALLMAGHHPEVWAGVFAWVPITDLAAWHHETREAARPYFEDIAASCGGAPGDSPAVDKEYRDRSPLTWLSNAKGVNVHINAGIRDGHEGSVPVSHSLRAFNALAHDLDTFSEEEIRYFVETARVPEHLTMDIIDPAYAENKPLFRRRSGKAEITLFNGGHEFLPEVTIAALETAYRLSE